MKALHLFKLSISMTVLKKPIISILGLTLALNLSCTSGEGKSAGISNADSASDSAAEDSAQTVSVSSYEAKKFIPNELGKVMVLEYHLIGEPEDRWRRTPANFRKDMQFLYDNNFYPVSVLDLGAGNLNVPAGKTPFAITLDDSSAGQFRFINKNGKLEIDPKCALGIMEDFKKKHSDFPLTATFYVLPAIKPNLRLFAQPENKKQKLEWLIKNGYEVGSHSWYHVPLSKLNDAETQKHLGMFVKEIKEFLPKYEVQSLALPLGERAKNKSLESKGSFEGTKYNHKVVLLVGSATSSSPYSKKFSPLAVQRVQAGDMDWGIIAFADQMVKNKTRFISDGDPKTITAPAKLKEDLNPALASKYKIQWVADTASTK
jgi:hypothetical protein